MKILLHVCCAPCATWCIEKLKNEGHNICLFYDNPNIYPNEEREKRLEWVEFLSDMHSLPLVVKRTPHEEYLSVVKGLEMEKEHGKRCIKCFDMNLSLSHDAMIERGCEAFTTTLTVSRYKSSKTIFECAFKYDDFLQYDFKKEGGFEKSQRAAKELGMYRQKYCGCEFSNNLAF